MAQFNSTFNNNSKYGLILTVTQGSQDITNNTTNINWELKMTSGTASFAGWYVNSIVMIDGETVFEEDVKKSISPNSTLILASGTKTIKHNDDGSKTVNIAGYASTATSQTYLPGTATCGGDVELTTILRKSSVSCITPFNIRDNVSVNISSKSDTFTHTIRYSFEGSTETVLVSGVRTTNKTYSYSWSTPQSFYTQGDMENKNSGSGYLTVETFNGNTSIGISDRFNFTANVTNSNPTIDATIIDTNTYVVNNLTGNNSILVKNLSNAQITATATLKNGATRKNYKVVNENKSSTTYPTAIINNITSGTFVLYVTDSRNNTNGSNGTTKKVTFKDYFYPYAKSIDIDRTEQTSTEVVANINGSWWNSNFGIKVNTLKYSYRFKNSDDENWGEWSEDLTPTINGNNFSISNFSVGNEFDTKEEYDIQFRLKDESDYYNLNAQHITKSIGIIDIYEDEVVVNGNLYVNGEDVGDAITKIKNLKVIEAYIGPNGATKIYDISNLKDGNQDTTASSFEISGMVSTNHYCWRKYIYRLRDNVDYLLEVGSKQVGKLNLQLSISGNSLTVTSSGSYGGAFQLIIFD